MQAAVDKSSQFRNHLVSTQGIDRLEKFLEQGRHCFSTRVVVAGEIGNTGTVGAIANAICRATASRIRHFPIRIQDLLAGG